MKLCFDISENKVEFDLPIKFKQRFFEPTEFRKFLLRIQNDIDVAHFGLSKLGSEPVGRNLPRGETPSNHLITYTLPWGDEYQIINTEDGLTFFLKSIKNNKRFFLKPKKQKPPERFKLDERYIGDEYRHADCSFETIEGQVRFILPQQRILLKMSKHKKWPKSTYTGKIKEVRKRKKRK